MHFDWTINIGTLATWLLLLGGGAKFYLTIRDTLWEIKALLREYPPHRHDDNGGLVYPKGMSPEG